MKRTLTLMLVLAALRDPHRRGPGRRRLHRYGRRQQVGARHPPGVGGRRRQRPWSVLLNATSLLPKVGKVLTISPVQVMLTTQEIVTSDSMTCLLTYKGKPLVQRALCSWKLPVALRKKKMTLSVTVTYQGATTSVTLPVSPR